MPALLRQAGADREKVEILALVLHHDEQAVSAAVELAPEAGVAPGAEPRAEVLRYDALRTARKARASGREVCHAR